MPTILRVGGLRVVVYPNDHAPGHVHVIGAGCEAVFELHCPEGPVALRESVGFTTSKLQRIVDQLASSLALLCAAWEKIHGPD
jgi:hypothetical protein